MNAVEGYRKYMADRKSMLRSRAESAAEAAIAELEAKNERLTKERNRFRAGCHGNEIATLVALEQAEAENRAYFVALEGAKAAIIDLSKRAEQAEAELAALKQTTATCMTLIEEKNGEIAWRDQELKRLGDANKANAAVMPLTQEHIAELEAENERLQGELNIIERNNTDHIATALDTNEALYAKGERIAELEALMDTMRENAVEREKRVAELEAELADRDHTIEQLRGVLQKVFEAVLDKELWAAREETT